MTQEQLHVLQHALGVDKFGLGSLYRNHYVGESAECRALIELGYMMEMKPRSVSGGDIWFMVTNAGIKAMREESPKPPKVTRSQQRMMDYRDFADAYDCSFKEFLQIQRTDWYKRMKAGIEPASVLGDYL